MRRIDVCGLSGFAIFFQIISHMAGLSKKNSDHKIRVSIFPTNLPAKFTILRIILQRYYHKSYIY